MIHLSSFTAVRYRGIDGLVVPHLTKANLITGMNGIGKTALLEAIWLFSGRHNPGLLWNANVQRSGSTSPILDPISRLTDDKLDLQGMVNGEEYSVAFVFEKLNGSAEWVPSSHPIQEGAPTLPPIVGFIRTYLDGALVEEAPKGVHLTSHGTVLHQPTTVSLEHLNCVIENARFQNEVPGEYLKRYTDLRTQGQKAELVSAMNMVVEEIKDVEILADDSESPYISVEMEGGKLLPIQDLGGGAVRLFRLLLGFSAAPNGIFLSDELENGIYYRAHRAVWDRAREWMAQWNVQFIATTHSGELVDAAIGAFEDAPDDLAIHQLFRNENTGQLEVATFTGESLLGARNLNLEVR